MIIAHMHLSDYHVYNLCGHCTNIGWVGKCGYQMDGWVGGRVRESGAGDTEWGLGMAPDVTVTGCDSIPLLGQNP